MWYLSLWFVVTIHTSAGPDVLLPMQIQAGVPTAAICEQLQEWIVETTHTDWALIEHRCLYIDSQQKRTM